MLTHTQPRFEQLAPKKLIGKKSSMSFANNQTAQLWRSFMPYRHTIESSVSDDLFSVQLYPNGFFDIFNPHTSFTKWAAKEVKEFGAVADGMETLELEGGLYAVFHYRGDASDAAETFGYIMGQWLPHSGYQLDSRHHFEVLGALFKNGDPNSEEEIWIPVKTKI